MEIQVPDDATLIDDSAAKDPPPPPVTVDLADAPDPKARPKIVTEDEGIAKLQAQLKAEEAAKLAAQRRASTAEAEAAAARTSEAAARTSAGQTELHLLGAGIENLTKKMDMSEAALANALAAGDHVTAAKINREMVTDAANLHQLEVAKKARETAPKVQPKPAPRAPITDPVENLIAQLNPASVRSHDYIRRHPEIATNQRMINKLEAADRIAVADGHERESEAYFESVGRTLGITAAVPDTGDGDPPPPLPQRRAPQAAPVSRSTNGTQTGVRARTVTLTGEQRAAAHFSFPDMAPGDAEREYAKNLLEIQREKLN